MHTLDGIVLRKKDKTIVALRCITCNTIVKIGHFPNTCPILSMKKWIDKKNTTLSEWHTCSLDVGNLLTPKLG